MAAPTDWVPVLNTTGEVIPAGGLMKVTGVDPGTGALSVAKPDTNDDASVCVNGFALIPANGTGQGSFDRRAIVAYDPVDGTPAAGDSWGAKAGTWLAKKSQHGFRVLGGAGLGLVNAVRAGVRGFEAVLTSFYDAKQGYSWKREKLDTTVPGYVDAVPGLSGKQAFSYVGETDLLPGTLGWMEPSPDGPGWIFIHCCGNLSSSSSSSGSSSSSSSSNPSGSSSSSSSSSSSQSISQSHSQSISQSQSGGQCCVQVLVDVAITFDPSTCNFTLTKTTKTLCATIQNGQICLTLT
ncbi:MAG: hypothetical protein JWO38_6856 [Gemmataceae bacterium]|nr:hypothetical protein [Gemmataceae bacterium]